MNEREANASLVQQRAADYRKMAVSLPRERATLFKEIADALDRTARFIIEKESV
jgi:hypothetical protein